MAQKQATKTEMKLYSENFLLKQELEKNRVEGKLCLDAETKRAERNSNIAAHNAGVAEKIAADLQVERIGRRALKESLRRERLDLVARLYTIDQRLRVLVETERAADDALLAVTGQVETEDGDALLVAHS